MHRATSRAIEIVPAGKRITGFAKCIQASTAGYQNRRLIAEFVGDALEQILPFWRLVQLVEHQQRCVFGLRQFANDLAVFSDVPIQILAV